MGAGSEEKTEKASPKKRRDQRKEGNIFQSSDVTNTIFILVAFYALGSIFPYIYDVMASFSKKMITYVGQIHTLDNELIKMIGMECGIAMVKTILPFALLCIAVSVLMTGIQTKFIFTAKQFYPKFNRLNPIAGIKKIISIKNIIELLKNILKMCILVGITYTTLMGYVVVVSRMLDMTLADSVLQTYDLAMSLVMKVTIIFAFIAVGDFMLQRWDYEKNIRMSKQEVKEEFKQMEGNPEIKGKIRDLQRQRARSRMMQAVPEADVIIRNPTHFAVALAYDKEKHGAPIVVAKGQDYVALRIVEIGAQHQVFTVENKPLARGIFHSTELNHQIPAEYYGVVAELLVYVYKKKKQL